MDFIGWVLAIAIGLILLALGVGIYDEVVSEKLTLTKAEWACTRSETQTVMYPQLVGKVTVMVPRIENVCQTYERVK